MGEPLQELSGAALLEARGAAHDQVFAQAHRVEGVRLHRQRHARIGGDVAELDLGGVEMAGDDLLAVEPDPDDGDPRAAVGGQRHEVRELARLDQLARGGMQRGHGGSFPGSGPAV